MANYSIKDLENFTGIKAHTIRIWEKRYHIVEPQRTSTNIRYYDDSDLKRLLNISILNRHGVKISNIVNFSDETINEKVLNLTHSKSDIDTQIEGLIVAMIDLDEFKFEKIFNTAIINMGFEETIMKLMYPFFERIGILWQIGTINPAQEHFISNLLRQKLIVAVDGIINSVNGNTRSFLLFLPEGEFHELGLIYYHYLIKKFRHKAFYLGSSVPLDGIKEISSRKKIDYVVTSLTTSMPLDEAESFLNILSGYFLNSKVFIAGLMTQHLNFPLPENFIKVDNLSKFKEELEKLS